MGVFGFGGEDKRPPVLASTLKVVAAVGILSYAASVVLSGSDLDRQALARLAAAASKGLDDPVTTGSVLRSAGSTKLDPCTVPRRN